MTRLPCRDQISGEWTMEGQAPEKPRKVRGYYTGRWKKAKDAFHRITAISTKQNKELLGAEARSEVGVNKSLVPLDAMIQAGAKPKEWEKAIAVYDGAMRAYLAM